MMFGTAKLCIRASEVCKWYIVYDEVVESGKWRTHIAAWTNKQRQNQAIGKIRSMASWNFVLVRSSRTCYAGMLTSGRLQRQSADELRLAPRQGWSRRAVTGRSTGMKQTTMSGPSRGQGADMKFPSEILELLSRTSLQFTLNKFKKIFSAHKITDPPR
jgi:hypothetical protein